MTATAGGKRGAKSAGEGSVLPKGLSVPQSDPHHGPLLGRGCGDGEADVFTTALPLSSPSPLFCPPSKHWLRLPTQVISGKEVAQPEASPSSWR